MTSSAEQEQDGCNQDIEDDSQVGSFNSSHLQKGNGPKDHEDSEETAVSPFSLGHGARDQLMLDRHSVIQTALGNTSVVSSEVSPGSLGHISRAMWLSTKDLTETLMLGSVAWEDLPLSDSLTEFFCEKQGCDITESQRNAHNQRERPRITPEITPQDKISSIQSSNASKGDHLKALMDSTNTPARREADGHDFSEQLCKNHVTSVNSIHAKNTSSDGCNQENEEEEEHCEMEVYNCSADLFSNVDMTTETPNRTVRSITKTRLLMSHKRRLSEQMNISHVTPNKHKLKQKKSDDMDNLHPPVTPQLHFIPPSQSTPIVTTGSPASYRCSTAIELGSLPDCQESLDLASHTPAKINLSLCKLNPLVKSLCHCDKTTSVSRSSMFTLKRRVWNPEITKRDRLPVQVQTVAPNIAPTEKVINRCGTSSAVVIVCGGINEILIPPTPLARTQPRAKPRKQSSAKNVQRVWEEDQEDGGNSGETARNQDCTSLWEPSGNQDSEAVVGASLGTSPCYLLDESNECDWSRDLFSDSA